MCFGLWVWQNVARQRKKYIEKYFLPDCLFSLLTDLQSEAASGHRFCIFSTWFAGVRGVDRDRETNGVAEWIWHSVSFVGVSCQDTTVLRGDPQRTGTFSSFILPPSLSLPCSPSLDVPSRFSREQKKCYNWLFCVTPHGLYRLSAATCHSILWKQSLCSIVTSFTVALA